MLPTVPCLCRMVEQYLIIIEYEGHNGFRHAVLRPCNREFYLNRNRIAGFVRSIRLRSSIRI